MIVSGWFTLNFKNPSGSEVNRGVTLTARGVLFERSVRCVCGRLGALRSRACSRLTSGRRALGRNVREGGSTHCKAALGAANVPSFRLRRIRQHAADLATVRSPWVSGQRSRVGSRFIACGLWCGNRTRDRRLQPNLNGWSVALPSELTVGGFGNAFVRTRSRNAPRQPLARGEARRWPGVRKSLDKSWSARRRFDAMTKKAPHRFGEGLQMNLIYKNDR